MLFVHFADDEIEGQRCYQLMVSCELSVVSSVNMGEGLLNKGYYEVLNCSGVLMASNITLSCVDF